MLIRPNGDPTTKRVAPLSHDQIRLFTDFERLLTRMGLRFSIYCTRCLEEGLADGCWGNNQTNSSQYVIECRCTRRVYETGARVN